MSRRSEAEMNLLKRSLKRIAEAQSEFWDAMSEFEKLTGVELTSFNNDFTQFAEPTDKDVLWVMKNYIEGAATR
jgi:flagellar motor switch protein FliM